MRKENGKSRGKLSAIFAAFLILGLVAAIIFPMSARADAVDLGKTCDVTLTLPDSYADGDTISDELDFVIDVYRIAEAEAIPGYDAYRLKVTDDFADLADSLKDLTDQDNTTVDVVSFAEDAAAIVRDASTALVPVLEGAEPGTKLSVEPGLYMFLAHGTDLERDEYFDMLLSDDETTESLVTIARSPKYTYHFSPMLITLPTRETTITDDGKIDFDTEALTSDQNEWVYNDIAATLKAVRKIRYTSFEIRKQLDTYEDRQPTTFVFQIDYVDDKHVPISLIESMVFSKAELQTITVEHIPVGSDVTVTEVYSGQNYVIKGEGTQELKDIQIPAIETEVNGVIFENDYDNTDKGGGSIKNEFSTVEGPDGFEWKLNQVYSQPQAAEE